MKFSWNTLPKPFTCLAPMEGVTDSAFRQMVAMVHKPNVMFTEFVSVEGMNSKGRKETLAKLQFVQNERPLVAQIWGITPEYFFQSAKDIADMGFDGIDINMGCPDKNVVNMGAGAALIENHELTGKIIRAVQEGSRSGKNSLPVSVKTRIGYRQKQTEEWVRFLLSHNLDALTIHGLTAKELYKKPADWEEIQKGVAVRNSMHQKTVIIGNGNACTYADIVQKQKAYNVDGVMIGRGILQDINCFDPEDKRLSKSQLMSLLIKHLELFESSRTATGGSFAAMKKYFKLYVRDFEGSSSVRERLMATKTSQEALTEIHAVWETREI